MIKKILSVLALSSVAVMGLSSVSASAAMTNSPVIQSNLKIVNSKSGLIVRDANCKKIHSIENKAFATVLSSSDLAVSGYNSLTKVCKINGKKVRLVLVAQNFGSKIGYVSSKFLTNTHTTKAVQDSYKDPATNDYFANSATINVRNKNCKVKTTVKIDTNLTKTFNPNDDGFSGESVACKIGNKYYDMVMIMPDVYVSPAAIYVK